MFELHKAQLTHEVAANFQTPKLSLNNTLRPHNYYEMLLVMTLSSKPVAFTPVVLNITSHYGSSTLDPNGDPMNSSSLDKGRN